MHEAEGSLLTAQCFLKLHPAQEDIMSEIVMKTEAEVEDFTDELSDEALDRAEGAYTCSGPRGLISLT